MNNPLGNTGLSVPPVIFGTSSLGNLYTALPWAEKLQILKEMIDRVETPALDSAGKYGAGLALEMIGRGFRELAVSREKILISNKLGWFRVPLTGDEPTFEPGVWIDLEYDAVQKISYDGILECWEQGCSQLGGYRPAMVSVHDPDEFLVGTNGSGPNAPGMDAAGPNATDEAGRFQLILDAYRALMELRKDGQTRAIGVGAKEFRVSRAIADKVDLDWVMLATDFTIYNHSAEVVAFVDHLSSRGVGVINSAVFNAGFLVGGRFFDYRTPDASSKSDKALFEWRDTFFALCREHEVQPAHACVQFGLSHPGIASVALNTSRPERIEKNVQAATATVPVEFWNSMKSAGLIDPDYSHVGS